MMAPEPPPDFVPRPKEFDAVKRQLLDAKGDSVAAITAALRGAGGYGKTTLAKALAHDRDIQDAYFDGILWAELGEKPDRLLSTLSDLITLLTGEPPELETINAAAAKLGEALGDRRILLVIDDAWREQDLKPFLQGGRHCVRLITTRIDSVLPQTALRQPVDAMQAGEALTLLSVGLPADQVARERATLAKLAARLGEWAQLLKIVNGFLRVRVVNSHETVAKAIAAVDTRLGAKGLVAFDPHNATDRTRAVARTIGVSLDLLSESERARFGELGVFPEDAEIPVVVVARLWASTGGLEDFETEDLLSRLFDLSLLLDLDLGQRVFRLHDTTRHFLRDRVGKDGLVAQHKQLVQALDGAAGAGTDARTRRYVYLYLLHHLAEAKERARLDALLLDPGWLQAKLDATASPVALVSDYQLYAEGEAQRLVGRTLRLIAGVCTRDPRQLPVQLATRLAGFKSVAASGFLDKARRLIPRPTIVPLRPTLTPPGAETARLDWLADPVTALCLLADGRLASGSVDKTIWLWDVATGAESARLEGHHDKVTALCLLADGRLASGSWKHDPAVGRGDRRRDRAPRGTRPRGPRSVPAGGRAARLGLRGQHNPAVGRGDRRRDGAPRGPFRRGLHPLPAGGRAARLGLLGPHDPALGRGDRRRDGAPRGAYRTGHRSLPAGGRAARFGLRRQHNPAVGRGDRRRDGAPRGAPRPGHRALPAGGRAARLGLLGQDDPAVGRGDRRRDGAPQGAYRTGHRSLPAGGRAARLGLLGQDVRLWDVATGAETAPLGGHADRVTALCLLADGRLASGSDGQHNPAVGRGDRRRDGAPRGAYPHRVTALCLLADGRLASGRSERYFDGGIQLWDVATGAETAPLAKHAGQIAALCLLADGRLAAGSFDDTPIRLWDVATGAGTAPLEGHSGPVIALCLLAEGRLASCSEDNTIRLWDVAKGTEVARLELDAPVTAIVAVAPRRLVAGDRRGVLHWLEVVD